MNAALVKEYKIAVPPVEHGKVLVVKVGTDDRPATTSDINQIMQVLKDAKDRPNATIVTHHCDTPLS
jgi:predicted TIM-barrel fold metal-dependent hydrolase